MDVERPQAAARTCPRCGAVALQPGDQPGRFHTPHGLALDSQGQLYVADTQNHRIQKFAV